ERRFGPLVTDKDGFAIGHPSDVGAGVRQLTLGTPEVRDRKNAFTRTDKGDFPPIRRPGGIRLRFRRFKQAADKFGSNGFYADVCTSSALPRTSRRSAPERNHRPIR